MSGTKPEGDETPPASQQHPPPQEEGVLGGVQEEGNDDASYEMVVDQINALKDEQKQFPLISSLLPITEGLDLLAASAATEGSQLAAKAQALTGKYGSIRTIRRDGSCFLRATSFRLFENLLEKTQAAATASDAAKPVQDFINNVLKGQQVETKMVEIFGDYVQDFHEVILEVLERIQLGGVGAGGSQNPNKLKPISNSEELKDAMISEDISEYLVCYFRYCVSLWIRTHQDDFAPFLFEFASVEEFCSQEVECVGKECDQLHITAFCQMFNFPLVVEHIDASAGADGSTHVQGPDPENAPDACCLLFRPGHYDVIYRKK